MDIPWGRKLSGYSRGWPRRSSTQVVLHESVTDTRAAAEAVLARRHLGVHYMVDRDASITQHVDLALAAAHAEGFGKPSRHNEDSVGLEVIGRYYGHQLAAAQKAAPQSYGDALVLKTAWADRAWDAKAQVFRNPERLYIMPTAPQLESTWALVTWLCAQHEVVDIPLSFPANERDEDPAGWEFRWGPWPDHEGAHGLMAHYRWAHADGLVPEHYLLARASGYEPDAAFAATVKAASSLKRRTTLPDLPHAAS